MHIGRERTLALRLWVGELAFYKVKRGKGDRHRFLYTTAVEYSRENHFLVWFLGKHV